MKLRHRLVAAALSAAVPFALAACGSSNPQADHAKASIKAMLVKDQATNSTSPRMTNDQSGCIANKVVDGIGVAQLQKDGMLDKKNNAVQHGLSNTNLSTADATTLVNAMFDCTQGGGLIVASLKKAIHNSANGAASATMTCIDGKVTAAFTKSLMIAIFSHDNAKAQTLQATLASCLTAH